MTAPKAIEDAIVAAAGAPLEERVAIYNATTRMLRERLLYDLPQDPALAPQLLPVDRVRANAYNPNKTAATELDLLAESVRSDGITMCVVVTPLESDHEVVDGFHRRLVAAERLERRYLPCAVITAPLGDRMASTVRHNRARGKHQVELMGELVKSMIALGWTDGRIASAMAMSEEEVLRLRQVVGIAQQLARPEYSLAWRGRDGAPNHSDE